MARANNNIKGRLALITEASGGIGAAVARSLLLQDVDLALHYSSDTLAIEDLVAQLRHDYEIHVHPAEDRFLRITTHQAELSSVEGCEGLLEDVRRVQGGSGPVSLRRAVDILVSNAHAAPSSPAPDISDLSVEAFEATLNANLRAAFVLTKGVVDGMKARRWGRLVYVSGTAASGSAGKGAHDAVSKEGVVGLMKNLSTGLAGWGITANAVLPGIVGETDVFPNDAATERGAALPLGRVGTPHEVANVVVMFATTGYVTGQSILVTGGSNQM